jgi:hypothetical protein
MFRLAGQLQNLQVTPISEIRLPECDSGTFQKFPFAVNTMTEVKSVQTTSENTGTLVSRNILELHIIVRRTFLSHS